MQFSPIVEKITQSRLDGLHLIPPDGLGSEDAVLSIWTVSAKKFGEFYITIFNEWVKKDVEKYYVQLFDAALAGTVGEMPGVCIFGEICGHATVMEFNGDVYAYDHYVFPKYKIENIRTHTIFELVFSQKQL